MLVSARLSRCVEDVLRVLLGEALDAPRVATGITYGRPMAPLSEYPMRPLWLRVAQRAAAAAKRVYWAVQGARPW